MDVVQTHSVLTKPSSLELPLWRFYWKDIWGLQYHKMSELEYLSPLFLNMQ